MKISWGYKIAILYGSFVTLIITLVTLTMKQKVELTYTDYYKREINYQQTLNKIENYNKLNKVITTSQNAQFLTIYFPDNIMNNASGKISLIRPNNSKLDQEYSLDNSTNSFIQIPKSALVKGYYIMQIEWKKNNKEYFMEKSIFIN